MRFSILAASLFAGAVMAESTFYTTTVITKTSCAATVTDCPARSTVVTTTSYPVITSSSVAPVYANTTTWAPVSVSSPAGVATSPAPSLSIITISTCVPTVIYSTVTIAPVSTSIVAPISTGSVAPPTNATSPTTPASPSVFTGAASSLQGSVAVAAFAGLAAFLFA